MAIHITLVNPPYPVGSHLHPPFLPLGLGYLAAVLEKNNYKVDIVDCQALKINYEQAKEEIRTRKPDIVGITSTTLTYKSALILIKAAKEVNPNIITMIGGPHVTFWDTQALEECPELDVVIRREGEQTILELVQKIESKGSFKDILGITYREGGKTLRTEDRPWLENLDELPFPAIHLWPIEKMRSFGEVIFPLTTSRGCVFWCNFCTAVRMMGRKYRMRSVKNVVDELEYLHKNFGAEHFTFYDDAFTVDQARTEQMCQEILARGLKIRWNCETRVDMVTKELLAKMKAAGCTDVWFGVESGSNKVLNSMDKGISIERTQTVFKWAHEVKLMTVANVILGFPTETTESIWETVHFIEKLEPDDVGYYIATPYPGTPMYEQVRDSGALQIFDFDKYDTATPTFKLDKLSMEELRDTREKAFHSFYLRPKYMFKVLIMGGVYGRASSMLVLAHLRRALRDKFSFGKKSA
jgi:anaerobic magnesium-protoporphyrin IX monomethyl ester cyclase